MIRKIFFFATIVVSLIIINSLVRSIYDLWHKEDLVAGAMQELREQKKENKRLKERLSYVKTDKFIEEEARNKLFMVKEGESEVIIPKELIAVKPPKPTPEPPNWEKWIDFILGE